MKPEQHSTSLLGVTRSKAKMYEYGVPLADHIQIVRNPAQLFTLAIGLLGDISAASNRGDGRRSTAKSIQERRQSLTFAARFFDAYLQARFEPEIDAYLLLLSSSAFYLCDLPGTSQLLAARIQESALELGAGGLERLLHWMLTGQFSSYSDRSANHLSVLSEQVRRHTSTYYANGDAAPELLNATMLLRQTVYEIGTPRQLLLGDVLSAVVRRRIESSAWHSLPLYSGLPVNAWRPALRKARAIRDLWPAQQLLGQGGVFQGKSAVVQMPTSAGKTRAIELVIRSAFIAGRTELVVIVAPFRALCHEVGLDLREAFRGEPVAVDELTDALQLDFDLEELLVDRRILVVTPEKLVYMIRHAPELANSVGLVIYDEGHQFDSGRRGVTYELLLTSLRSLIPTKAQSILISAVITNSEAVGAWMHGAEGTTISGTNLTPMYRTVAFASWLDQLGQLKFVADEAPEKDDFFVPRILNQHDLRLRGREKKERRFPERNDGPGIAVYLGLRLVGQGSVAIFCGRKDTAANLCEKAVDAYARELPLTSPLEHSDPAEVGRLVFLYTRHLGAGATAARSAALGIFAHHGNTTEGIRLAVEYAMKKELIRFVICTSTLAQGVNLPIRYLIVTSVYQGAERIKVRDFHNLIGRAGRAGMHTEGTILFADPVVYDQRRSRSDGWRWTQIQQLLDAKNSEPVLSALQTLFAPLHSLDGKLVITMEPLEFARRYIRGEEHLSRWVVGIVRQHAERGFTKDALYRQVKDRLEIIAAIESYVMSYWEVGTETTGIEYVRNLAEGTLAYSLSDDAQKTQLREFFALLAEHILRAVPDANRRAVYGKTLQGLVRVLALEAWLGANLAELRAKESHEELLTFLWPILSISIANRTFQRCDKPEVMRAVALCWLAGDSFGELHGMLVAANARIIAGTQKREFSIDQLVDVCENGFGYDGALLIGAIADLLKGEQDEANESLIARLGDLHKRFKYGLLQVSAVALYECGFADREVSKDLAHALGARLRRRERVAEVLKKKEDVARKTLAYFPAYFSVVLDNLIA